jgi:glucose 1-dehydrogenase
MQKRLLEQQRALVTGASSGIGEAIARAFAGTGASVIVNYRSSREDAESIAAEIRKNGRQAYAIQADISRPEDCERLFKEANQALDGLDILVANAGVQRDATSVDIPLKDWQTVIDTNLTG